jgi:hypothetical protein
MNARDEDITRAARIIAVSTTRSILTGLASSCDHGVAELTVTLPDMDADAMDALTVAYLQLAAILNESMSTPVSSQDETWAKNILNIQPKQEEDNHE